MDKKDEAQTKLEELKKSFKLGTYQHYKGSYYTVYALSVKEDTCELLVHYYSHEHKTRWTRTIDDFRSRPDDPRVSPQVLHAFRSGRFQFVRDAHPIQLLRAAGFDDMIEGFENIAGAISFFKRVQGG